MKTSHWLKILYTLIALAVIYYLVGYYFPKPNRMISEASLNQFMIDAIVVDDSNSVKLPKLDYTPLNRNEIIFYQSLDFYDKIITILIALIALSGLAAYIYIRSISLEHVEETVDKSVAKVVETGKIINEINSKIDETVKTKMEPINEVMDKYSKAIVLMEQLDEKVNKFIIEVNQKISDKDTSEKTDDDELSKEK